MTHPLLDHGTDPETLARRIDQLRRDLDLERRRRSRLERLTAIACLLVLGAGGIAATAFRPVADVVRTHRLEIVDDSNRIVMLASAAKHGGRIDLWDDAGINAARLGGNGTGGESIYGDKFADENFPTATTFLACSAWLTPGQIPTDPNSSSPPCRRHGLTENT